MGRRYVVIASALAVAGCGSLGSLGFGQQEEPVTVIVSDNAVAAFSDQGPVIQQVVPEAALRGVILRATALAPTLGYHTPRLVPRNRGAPDQNGIVTLNFVALPPETAQPVGTERVRRLTAAAFFTDAELEDISGFVVRGGGEAISLRR